MMMEMDGRLAQLRDDTKAQIDKLTRLVESLDAVLGPASAPSEAPAPIESAPRPNTGIPLMPNVFENAAVAASRRPQSPEPTLTNGPGLDEKAVLRALRNGPLNQKSIAESLAVSKYLAKPILERMIQAKVITRTGSGRGQTYQLA